MIVLAPITLLASAWLFGESARGSKAALATAIALLAAGFWFLTLALRP